MTIVPVTTSLDEFKIMLACELSLMQAEGAGRMELERHAQQRVRATYGLPAEDVAAWLIGQHMQINYRVPARPEMIRIDFTIKESTMFEVNDDDWADVPAGTMRAVPGGPASSDFVHYEVFDGQQWRRSGQTATLYPADVTDVTAEPQDTPSA